MILKMCFNQQSSWYSFWILLSSMWWCNGCFDAHSFHFD